MTGLADFSRPLFLVGCGAMAGAMLSRWMEAGLRATQITVLRPSGKAVADGVQVITSWPDHLPDDALVLLGMKPQQLGDIAPNLRALWRDDLTLLSLLAGITAQQLADVLTPSKTGAAVVRVMPNTPVALGKGVCALYADAGLGDEQRQLVDQLFAPLGLAEWIADEGQFNLVTALTGCGPAYLYRFVDALTKGAVALGLEPGQAQRFSIAMVEGAATLAARADIDPAALADRVASKGGMTREGLNIMDEDGRIEQLMLETLRAAQDRGAELAKLAG